MHPIVWKPLVVLVWSAAWSGNTPTESSINFSHYWISFNNKTRLCVSCKYLWERRENLERICYQRWSFPKLWQSLTLKLFQTMCAPLKYWSEIAPQILIRECYSIFKTKGSFPVWNSNIWEWKFMVNKVNDGMDVGQPQTLLRYCDICPNAVWRKMSLPVPLWPVFQWHLRPVSWTTDSIDKERRLLCIFWDQNTSSDRNKNNLRWHEMHLFDFLFNSICICKCIYLSSLISLWSCTWASNLFVLFHLSFPYARLVYKS